jgi:hypothetical protein
MRFNTTGWGAFLGGVLAGGLLSFAATAFAADGYPADYKPSKPAEKGDTNVLTRFGAVTTYVNDKLTDAGGDKSPQCYRNCTTVALNEMLKCIEGRNTYASSESCEKDAANRVSACDPKCQ